MSIKIRNNNPFRKSIDIDISDGVSIHLHKQEYGDLIGLLLTDMEQEIQSARTTRENADKKRDKCWEFLREIREVFYNCSDEDFCLARNIQDIDREKLSEVLDRYSKLLGFE